MNYLNLFYLIFVSSCLFASCENHHEITAASDKLINSDTKELNGNVLTFGYFSDILDENLTIQSAKEAFGDDPLVFEDGDTVELTYAVDTDKIYENGLRITTVSITFSKGVMVDSSIGFTRYSE